MRTREQRRVLARTQMRELIRERTQSTGRSYARGTLLGAWHHVKEAVDTKELFEHYEALDMVSLHEYADECVSLEELKGDMFCPKVNDDMNPNVLAKQEQEYEQMVEREGVWVVEVCVHWPPGDPPDTVDSLGGVEGGLAKLDSGYLVDLMRSGLQELAVIRLPPHHAHWVEHCHMMIELNLDNRRLG